MIDGNTLVKDFRKLRETAPLVHNITNYVVMNYSANVLLAAGASPVMAHAVDEVADMVNIASSLVINIGTLSQPWIDAMIIAGKKARERGIPLVFDPVGAGATSFRTKTSMQILEECKPNIIRGNASEIMALTSETGNTKGVDSVAASGSAIQAARQLSEQTGAVVVVSGETDYIIDNKDTISIMNGSPLMTKITGMGCSASALTAAFAAINPVFNIASAHAMAVMGIAGELAARKSEGPGSLQINFLDILYKLTDEDLKENLRAGI